MYKVIGSTITGSIAAIEYLSRLFLILFLVVVLSRAPDLVLMDMGLPVLDGWQATTQAKEDDGLKDIPIIALTAHALETDRQKALAAGADDFDTKPVDFKRLLGKIESLIG